MHFSAAMLNPFNYSCIMQDTQIARKEQKVNGVTKALTRQYNLMQEMGNCRP